MSDDARRVALVTGASAGIGAETAVELGARGFFVIVHGRSAPRAEQVLERVKSVGGDGVVQTADFSSLPSVARFAEELATSRPRLDVLVNNAGLWHQSRTLSKDGYEDTFAVNHLAPMTLTERLLPSLREAASQGQEARIVHVSSRLHIKARGMAFDDLMSERGKYRGLRVYAHSKLANILYANELAERLAGENVTSNSVHPGDVATTIVRDSKLLSLGIKIAAPFLMTAAEGAATSVHLASEDRFTGVTGKYFVNSRERAPSRFALDRDAGTRLRELSLQLIADALA